MRQDLEPVGQAARLVRRLAERSSSTSRRGTIASGGIRILATAAPSNMKPKCSLGSRRRDRRRNRAHAERSGLRICRVRHDRTRSHMPCAPQIGAGQITRRSFSRIAMAAQTRCPLNRGKSNVEHKPNGAFHAFRRAVATALVERRGLAHASRYLGDTADVLARTYLKPTQESERQAVAAVMEVVSEWQRKGNKDTAARKRARQTPRKMRQRRTGAGGFEPPTSWLTARRSAN